MNNRREAGAAGGHGAPSRHESLILDQFSRQAPVFARSPELHAEQQLRLLVDAARPQAGEESLDVACGPGSVVAAFAALVRRAVGLDATAAMLEQARTLERERGLSNVEWHQGDVYRLPFADAAFDIVSCRFAVHHFQEPARAFAEMTRVCRRGGRVLVCDGLASADAGKAQAFNAMERHRDPSTAEFRTLPFLLGLFGDAEFAEPSVLRFRVTYERERMIAQSFPANDDRAGLRRMIDALIATDAMDVGSLPGGTRFTYPAAVLSAIRR
jgi:ubiquinone/menaquinone biosynthesis C-methylase UbiE